MPTRAARTIRTVPVLLYLIALVGGQSGCVTRTVRSPLIDRFGIQVDLVREVKGFTTQTRNFEHPAIISIPRLSHILGAVEIETPGESGGTIRQPAFRPEIIERTATALSEALAKADPDQEIGVQVIRKEMKLGVFNKKYLTSFLAHIENDHLYLVLRRVDWPISKSQNAKRLPKPRRDERPMNFRIVSGEPLFYAGPQTLEIAWRDPAFQTGFRLPGTTKGEKRHREVLLDSPIPKSELDATVGTSETLGVDELSAEQLHALADLEEDRNQGRITETTYQRARRQLLRRR